MTDDNAFAEWVGRSETRIDTIQAGPLDRLAATLDRDEPPVRPGDIAPPLSHWLHFLPGERQSTLGEDGHPRRGGFLPPLHHLPRRMWAGSRLTFPGDLHVGMTVERISTIASITRKEGKAGELYFVTVRHDLRETGGPVLLIDEHDIVYRGGNAPAATIAPQAPAPGAWRRSLVPDAVMLFRYSALTFNGHRIHYDRSYVTGVEGYPGLVVHGPLTATLLIDLIRRNAPQRRITSFSFKAVSPLFDGAPMIVHATLPDPSGALELWATNAEDGLAMRASAVLQPA